MRLEAGQPFVDGRFGAVVPCEWTVIDRHGINGRVAWADDELNAFGHFVPVKDGGPLVTTRARLVEFNFEQKTVYIL